MKAILETDLLNYIGGERILLYRAPVSFNAKWKSFETMGALVCQVSTDGDLSFYRDVWSDLSLKSALQRHPVSIEFLYTSPETAFMEVYQEDNENYETF
ncbi:MAG: hypothetical protein FJ161_02410 [Gammaproteobacteria bacterium]|nr:hypothetical protein [Gammaproteobacteria bacterium]